MRGDSGIRQKDCQKSLPHRHGQGDRSHNPASIISPSPASAGATRSFFGAATHPEDRRMRNCRNRCAAVTI
ncbi:hypothetical protein KSP40_PGU000207 [Platanthera guangdongensis]|uniref:Uncharacterized protein n=1 Tax=Platanthera guangdongensis TaxID=2320717 RepID=A0ABR2LWA8_9ASPA